MAETDIVDPDMVAPLLRKMRSPLAGVAADALERQAAEIARITARVAELEEPWRPIDDEARNGQPWLIQTAGDRVFKAQWIEGICEDGNGHGVGAWVAVDEDVRPSCWTDCICWDSNEDEVPSDPPVKYAPLPPAPDTKE